MTKFTKLDMENSGFGLKYFFLIAEMLTCFVKSNVQTI